MTLQNANNIKVADDKTAKHVRCKQGLINTELEWDRDQYYAKALTLTVGVHYPSPSPGPFPLPL